MEKVTSKELQRKFGQIRAKAHQGGVMITHHGNDDLAIVSAAEYARLKAIDLRAHSLEELSDEVIDGFGTEPVADEAGEFDHEHQPG